ncbi:MULTISPECIES: mechanosensitive ion channel family protein [unclassified Synechocystis]|uniref:mechanosensitive ion channel family protein n=1 Tax=unclassified Synechocystis TaxID=2640012 RepID=UPI00040E7EC9|nr:MULTISPECIES: mechanosensitive ion channel family protein [unclassified Synechocystis]AIE72911.1 Potassium efflux system KefA protein / Small-conductance mechanosensitive channel [Synechocystis sp. PCC 6714]MCT0252606.1 mechanosensitive ion channel family protein [Synechocystis sp. CS-94]
MPLITKLKKYRRKYQRFFWLGCIVLALLLTIPHPSQAQFVMPQGFSGQSRGYKPPEVSRYGPIEVAPVRSPIDNSFLFNVASPTVYDRQGDNDGVPVEQRAQDIKSKLELAIFGRDMNPDDLRVETSRLNNVVVVTVSNDDYPLPLVLASVTENDADFNGQTIDVLAERWRKKLDEEIRRGQASTTPEALEQSFKKALQISAALLVATAVIAGIKYLIFRYRQLLLKRKQAIAAEQEQQAESEVFAENHPDPIEARYPVPKILGQRQRIFWQRLPQILNIERKIGFWQFIQWLLFWVIILGWYFGLFAIFREIPGLATLSGAILGRPLQLLLLWFFVGLAIRIGHRIIELLKDNWQNTSYISLNKFINLGDNQRRDLRISTIAGAIKGVVTVVITTSGLLTALTILGIPTGSVVAIGGLVALAISFGSQSLVKDLVDGFLVLAEDQYAIGDVIDVGFAAGGVENLNLRVTQLRSAGGELVTIPNSAITQVKNLTRSWSRANVSINVAYDTDPAKAINVLRQVGENLYDDPEWRDKMLAVPDVLGIDSLTHEGMTITIWIQTAPAQQWSVGRELRFRVRQALTENNIEIGVPRRIYTTNGASTLPFSAIESTGEI